MQFPQCDNQQSVLKSEMPVVQCRLKMRSPTKHRSEHRLPDNKDTSLVGKLWAEPFFKEEGSHDVTSSILELIFNVNCS